MACLHETQAQAFVAGELAGPARAVVEDHVDDCESCRQLLAALVRSGAAAPHSTPALEDTLAASTPAGRPASASDDWAPGTRIGRYVVLARIGRGGMGTVFRAEDVELGRPVALKRLHAGADAEARARLVREARSAAQLQHPNVVTVHEVGEHAGTPFLAMELVDGLTLTAWLRDRTRSWREIIGVVAQAGRGLAAAHARGLVHRDFKPDNVLIDRAGRARVADFGLARAGDQPSGQRSTPVDERLARMTDTGSLAGTPAYMAPELVDGAPPDARSDQYAFAITLHEALHGQHPFAGDTAGALWLAMAEGRVRTDGRRVPAWLDRHVRRGLEVAPEQRWPDVASFVAAIERPRRPAWPWLTVAGAAATLGIVGVVVLRPTAATGPSCDELANEYEQPAGTRELARVIADPRQLAIAVETLERFSSDYRNAVRVSCRATRAGTQSAALGDKRTACLEAARRRAWFVTRGITTGVETRPGLASLLEELPDLSACSDPDWLARAPTLPVTAAAREALYLAESKLLDAGKARDDGKLAEATRLIDAARGAAMELGDRSLAARASLLAVEIARDRGDMRQAESDAMEAWTAASAYGDSELTLRAQLALLGSSATRDHRAMEGFAGLGTDVPESANGARLLSSYGDALMAAGKLAEGEQAYRRAQEIRERVLPADHVDRALGLQRIGAALAIQKRGAEALRIFEQTQPWIERAFPPLRREAIEGLRYRAMVEDELGRHDRALALRRDVVARRTQVLGANAGLVLDARADVARSLGDLGNEVEAARELEAVVAGHVAALGETSLNAADARLSLANTLITLGRHGEADAELARAIPVLIADNGPDSARVLVAHYAQVRAYVERPKPIKLKEATALLARIEPVFAKLFGASSYPVAAALSSRARIALAQGKLAAADAQVSRAIAMLGDDKRSDRAELALFHARVLWRLGRRDEARTRAEASARDYDAAGPGYATRAAAARAWAAKPPT